VTEWLGDPAGEVLLAGGCGDHDDRFAHEVKSRLAGRP
jgi:hypothetical protein